MNRHDEQWKRLARAAARVRPAPDAAPAGFATEVVARWNGAQVQTAVSAGLPLFDRFALRGLGAACAAALLAAVWVFPLLSSGTASSDDSFIATDAVAALVMEDL